MVCFIFRNRILDVRARRGRLTITFCDCDCLIIRNRFADCFSLDVSTVVGTPYAVMDIQPNMGPVTGGTTVKQIGKWMASLCWFHPVLIASSRHDGWTIGKTSCRERGGTNG